jgi:hypothetical protein
VSVAIATPKSLPEYLRSLSDQDKEAAMMALIDEFVRTHGDKYTIALRKPQGELLAYLVPPAAAEASLRVRIPELTPERRAETQAALANPDDTFNMDEFLDELSRRDRD